MNELVFILTIHLEEEAQILECLQSLRSCYPSEPVLVISDGIDRSNDFLRKMAATTQVIYYAGKRLKRLQSGSEWWQRFFSLAILLDSDWTAKFDADTRFHHPITMFPAPNVGVCGSIMSPGAVEEHVQGGFQLMSRRFIRYALTESRDPSYYDPKSWDCGNAREFIDSGMMSTDFVLARIVRRLAALVLDHPEIDCRPLPLRKGQSFRCDSAVTHPHK